MLDERLMVAGERIHVMAADPVAQKSDRRVTQFCVDEWLPVIVRNLPGPDCLLK